MIFTWQVQIRQKYINWVKIGLFVKYDDDNLIYWCEAKNDVTDQVKINRQNEHILNLSIHVQFTRKFLD